MLEAENSHVVNLTSVVALGTVKEIVMTPFGMCPNVTGSRKEANAEMRLCFIKYEMHWNAFIEERVHFASGDRRGAWLNRKVLSRKTNFWSPNVEAFR